jgi:hypothetical protein
MPTEINEFVCRRDSSNGMLRLLTKALSILLVCVSVSEVFADNIPKGNVLRNGDLNDSLIYGVQVRNRIGATRVDRLTYIAFGGLLRAAREGSLHTATALVFRSQDMFKRKDEYTPVYDALKAFRMEAQRSYSKDPSQSDNKLYEQGVGAILATGAGFYNPMAALADKKVIDEVLPEIQRRRPS